MYYVPIFSLFTLASRSFVSSDWITDLDVVCHSFCCQLIACSLRGAGRHVLHYVRSVVGARARHPARTWGGGGLVHLSISVSL